MVLDSEIFLGSDIIDKMPKAYHSLVPITPYSVLSVYRVGVRSRARSNTCRISKHLCIRRIVDRIEQKDKSKIGHRGQAVVNCMKLAPRDTTKPFGYVISPIKLRRCMLYAPYVFARHKT